MGNLSIPLFIGLVNQARLGEADAARELARYIVSYLEKDYEQPMHPPMREYLKTAFKRIADGADPSAALLLKKRRGGQEAKDSLDIALEVHRSQGKWHKNPGGAYYEVARRLNKSPEAVESAHRKWRPAIEESDRINREEWEAERHARDSGTD